MGTNISAHLYMIATVTAFSLFTAYQFLSFGRFVCASESKMRPYPSCMYWRLCAYMMEMIATSFFFAYCVSNFEHWFLFSRGLDNRAILSYNTTSAEEGQGSSLLFADRFYLTTCLSSLGMSLTTCSGRYVSSLLSIRFFSKDEAIFERFCHLKSMTTYQSFGTWIWPHLWP